MPWITERSPEITWPRLQELIDQTVAEARRRISPKPKRVLLLPPDITRMHSGAGRLTEMLFERLSGEADVHVIPTLGQHVPHTVDQNRQMFGAIPNERIHPHDWRGGCVHIGEIPAEMVRETTGGAADWAIPVVLSRTLMESGWDWIINIGHVVPHEVLGFANHNKNYFIGLGGKNTICAAHMAAACYGIENNLGQLITPLRACFNWAEERYLGGLPDLYVQVVMKSRGQGARHGESATGSSEGGNDEARMTNDEENHTSLVHSGFYAGDDLETYLSAARQSREENITVFDEPVPKIVCVMQGDEFHSTWVANKSVYRTRMAIAAGGELIVIAPGLVRFGEQPDVDTAIRKYGYSGTPRVMAVYKEDPAMQDLAHATAHLIHGSPEGRFRVTYAPGHLSQADIERVNFGYLNINEAIERYRPDTCQPGWNTDVHGEKYYFIPTPSAGLWATRGRMAER